MRHPFITTEYTPKTEVIAKIQFKPGRPWVSKKFETEDALDRWIQKRLPCLTN